MVIVKKITAFMANYTKMLGKYPVEMGLFALLTIFVEGAVWFSVDLESDLFGFAPAIMLAYIINNLNFKYSKVVYRCSWLSLLIFIPLFTIDKFNESLILLYVVLFPILVIQSRRRAENSRFIDELIRYLYAWVEAWLFSSVLTLILVGICESFVFIFNVGGDLSFYINKIIYEVCFIFITPSLFFSSLMNNLDRKVLFGKSIEFFVNYIISLPFIIYTAILSIYVIKIIVVWELPKGGVAMMVMVFMLFNAIVSSLQGYLKRPVFDWFFKRINYVSIPLMLMFWVAASRRVVDFGFTQERVYLFIVGIIATIYLIMFISKRFANYYKYLWVVFVLISAIAFVPMLAPKELANASQYNILVKNAIQAEMFDSEQKFIMVKRDSLDIKYIEEYKRIESAIDYLRRNDKSEYIEMLGVRSFSEIREYIISDVSADRMSDVSTDDNKESFSIYAYDDSRMIDISGYKYFFNMGYKNKDKCDYKYTDRELNIYIDNELRFNIDIDKLFEMQLSKIGKSDYYIYSNRRDLDKDIVKDILIFESEDIKFGLGFLYMVYYKDEDKVRFEYNPSIEYIIVK